MVNILKKILVIIIYLAVLTLLYLSVRYRYGITTESFKRKEKFVSDTRSYGTLLRNVPQVNDLAKTFMAVKPQRFKDSAGYSLEMPKEFNGIEVWKDYLSPITQQGNCGSCWSHSSVCSLADRFAILSLGQIKFVPSPFDPTICGAYYSFFDIEKQWGNVTELQKLDDYFQGRKVDPTNTLQSASCEGTSLAVAAGILFTQGVTDITCFPSKGAPTRQTNYDVLQTSVGHSSDFPYCYQLTTTDLDTCIDQKTAMKRYRAKTFYNVGDPTKDTLDQLEQAMMHEIYRNGPIVSGFVVFDDFMTGYDGKTIYQHLNKSANSEGGHAIRVVGWGEDTVNGEVVPYWWIANSWGTDWGINGYFRMQRKIPECQLEQNAMAMLPDFAGLTITDSNVIPVETNDEINIKNFTKHYLDPTSGFYTSGIDKIKNCKLKGNVVPNIDPNFKLPDYNNSFYAAEIQDYLSKNPITQPPVPTPLVTCSTSPSSTPTDQDVSQAISDGVVVPGSDTPTPSPTPSSSGGVVQPTPSPHPNVQQTRKVCVNEKVNRYTPMIDKLASHLIYLDVAFGVLGVVGSYLIWRLLDDSVEKLGFSTPITPTVSVVTPAIQTTPVAPITSTPVSETTLPPSVLQSVPSLGKL